MWVWDCIGCFRSDWLEPHPPHAPDLQLLHSCTHLPCPQSYGHLKARPESRSSGPSHRATERQLIAKTAEQDGSEGLHVMVRVPLITDVEAGSEGRQPQKRPRNTPGSPRARKSSLYCLAFPICPGGPSRSIPQLRPTEKTDVYIFVESRSNLPNKILSAEQK